MPSGVSLGGAYFELTGSSAGLITALKQAEDASKKSVQAIAQQTGIAEKDVQRLAQTYVRESQRMADARAAATLKIIKADNDAAQSSQKVAASQQNASKEMLGYVKAGGAFVAAAAGITTGAAAINAAMSKVAEETQKAAQAQFAINELYGKSAPLVTDQAEALAKLAGVSRTSAKEAAANVATLGRNYALTGSQIQQVLKISADLAAVRGISLDAAAERTASALRGEAEAIEYLGQALQSDTLKAMADMTDEQRKYFETLNPITKAQIVLNALQKNTADVQGAAARRTQDAAGATQNLDTAISNLSETIGKKFQPAVSKAQNTLAGFISEEDRKLKDGGLERLGLYYQTLFRIATLDFNNAAISAARLRNALDPSAAAQIQVGPDPGMPGSGPGPTKDQLQAIKDADQLRRQREAADKDALQAWVARQTKAIGEVADAREKAARAAAKLEDDAIEKEKIRLEVQKDQRLRALDETHRATIKSIEVEQQAAEDAAKAQIERLEQEKKATLDAAEMARDQALAALKAKKEQLDGEREIEDRNREDTRRYQDNLLQDRRRQQDQEIEEYKRGVEQKRDIEDRARETRQRQEDQERADRRDKADRELDEAREREDRQLEARVRRLQQERAQEDRARADQRTAEDQAVSDRREREDREAEASHKATLDRLEQEHDARLKVIEDQITAARALKEQRLRDLDEEADRVRAAAEQASRELDARYEQETRARDAFYEQETRKAETLHEQRIRDLDAEAEAARDVADATLRGIEEQSRVNDDYHRRVMQGLADEKGARLEAVDAQIAALDKLDEADQQAAQDQSQGDAVSRARFGLLEAQSSGNQSKIVEAQQELDRALAAITQTRAKRERDAARDVLKAQKDSIADEIDARARAEDERNRQRERELADQKQATQDALADQLAKIAARKDAEQTAYAAARQAAQDAYAAEKQAAQDTYEKVRQEAADTLAKQIEAIAKRRQAVSDETDALLADLDRRKQTEQDAYQREVDRVNAAWELYRQRLSDRRDAEDRERDARRTKEDRDRDDTRVKEDKKLADAKTQIADQRQKEDDAIDARRTREDRDLSERRIRDDNDRKDRRDKEDIQFQEGAIRLQNQRINEDRALQARRLAEDRQRDDYRRAEDLKLSAQQAAVEIQYQAERDATERHFNGPNGVITQTQKAMEQAKTEYRLRKEYAEQKFNEERDALNLVYRNPAKTGLLDLQDEAARNNAEKLSNQLGVISAWKDQAGKFIDENKGKWNDLATAIEAVGRAIRGLPASYPVPGGVGPPAPPGTFPPPGGGGRGEPIPPPSPPPSGGGGAPPSTPTPIPSQVNQYSFSDLSKLEKDAACGPATISWFSSMLGRPLSGREAVNIAKAAGWDTDLGMHGPGAMSRALGSVGVKNAIEPATDNNIDGLARRRVPFALSTGEHYYQVYGGSKDGLGVGGSGLALTGGSSVMSLGKIKSRGYAPQAVVVPDESVIHTHASGYLFGEPTLTYGLHTGERGMIAETGRPERLLGVNETAAVAAMQSGSYRFAGEAMPERMTSAGTGGGGGRVDRMIVDIALDNQKKQTIVFEGIGLLVRRGDVVDIRR